MASNYEIGQSFAPDDLRDMALKVAEHYDLPRDMYLGLLAHESAGWKATAKNPESSATGLAQFIDGTAQKYFQGLGEISPQGKDPNDPRYHPGWSMDAAARYLRDLYAERGSWTGALQGYYGSKSPEENQKFVEFIKSSAQREADYHERRMFQMGGGMAADLGPGLAPRPGPELRPPAPEVSPIEMAKDYLGWQDLSAFMPIFNRQTGLWEVKASNRKLYQDWNDNNELYQTLVRSYIRNAQEEILGVPGAEMETFGWGKEGPITTEAERMVGQAADVLTFGLYGYGEKKIYGERSEPETEWGKAGGGALQAGAFFLAPIPAAHALLGTRLAPTRAGIRAIVQAMNHGAASLGLATGLANLLPAINRNETWAEAAYDWTKSTAAGATIGWLFPVLGVKEANLVPKVLKMAAAMAALDLVHTRFNEAPDKGWFTIDDVWRGVMDGSLNKVDIAKKTFDYALDLIFISRTPTMRRQLVDARANVLMREAAKSAAGQEAEDVMVDLGKSRREWEKPDPLHELYSRREAQARLQTDVEARAEAGKPIADWELRRLQEYRQAVERETAAVREEIDRRVEAGEQPTPALWARYRTLRDLAAEKEAGVGEAGASPERAGTEAGAAEAGKGIYYSSGGDSINGEYHGYIAAVDKQTNIIIGQVTYVYYDGETSIKMVEVIPEYQRQGIAINLLNKLQAESDNPIKQFGNFATKEGEKLWKKFLQERKKAGTEAGAAEAGEKETTPQGEVGAPGAGAGERPSAGETPAAPERSFPPGVKEFQEKYGTARGKQPEGLLTKKRRQYDEHKALECFDLATLIKIYGGFNPQARIIKNFSAAEQKRIRLFSRRGAQSPDELLQELKIGLPGYFDEFETDADLLRAIADNSIYKKLDIAKMEKEYYLQKEQKEHWDEISKRLAANEEITDEAIARATMEFERELAAEEEYIRAEREAIQSEGSAESYIDLDKFREFTEEEQFSLNRGKAKPTAFEARLSKLAEDYPGIDKERASAVLRTFPEASDGQVANLTADPELYAQVVKGNLDEAARLELLRRSGGDVGRQERLLEEPGGLFGGAGDLHEYQGYELGSTGKGKWGIFRATSAIAEVGILRTGKKIFSTIEEARAEKEKLEREYISGAAGEKGVSKQELGKQGEIQRIESPPYNFVVTSDGELRISSSGRFIEKPDQKIINEARNNLAPEVRQIKPGLNKESWQKPFYQYAADQFREMGPQYDDVKLDGIQIIPMKDIHKRIIQQAINEKRIIPPEVLADYPDLAAKYVVPPKPKEPWEMTKAEVIEEARAQGFNELTAELQHEAAVDYALSQGWPVAPENLQAYPETAAKYGKGPVGKFLSDESGELATNLGSRLINWLDKRLERSLPPWMRNPDASPMVGSLLLKLQMFEDIGKTYPEAAGCFAAGRAGRVTREDYAADAFSFMQLYLEGQEMTPASRKRIDKVLNDLNQHYQNSPGFDPLTEPWRLRNIEAFRRHLLEPDERLREMGIGFYQARGLNRYEAEAAYGVRMSLDYAKYRLIEGHSRDFREWLEGHGFDPLKIEQIMDHTLNTEAKIEDWAKAYFGPQPGPKVVGILGHYRDTMQYWLKEAQHYIPQTRYGEYFIRVFDRSLHTNLKVRSQQFLDVLAEHFPGGIEGARDPRNWRNEAGRWWVPPEIEMAYRTLREAYPDIKKAPRSHELVEEARRAVNELVHAEAAESIGQYHEKMARLRQEFSDPRYEIKDKLEKKLPMELYTEADVSKIWKIIYEGLKSGKMPQGTGDAMVESWQDFFAAKGFGSHYIRRGNIPGYETDLLRPLSDYHAGLGGYLGKMEMIREFTPAFAKIPRTMPNVMREMNNYANYLLSNPYEFQGVRNLIYNLTLGGNISFHLINSLQNISMGWPVLGQVSGKPARELAGALKDWGTYVYNGEGLSAAEEAALIQARRLPELVPSMAAELTGSAYNPLYRYTHQDPSSYTRKALDVFKEFWQGLAVEKMNRESFFLAAYRATEGNFDRSIELTRQAHILYGKENRMAVGRGPGAMFTVFMSWTNAYLTLLKNFGKAAWGANPEIYGGRWEGVKGMSRMFAGAAMMGGLTGTLLWPVLSAAYEKVLGGHLEDDAKKYLAEDLGVGEGLAQFGVRAVVRGLPAAALGIDIGSRIAPNLPMMNLKMDHLSMGSIAEAALGAGSIPVQRLVKAGQAYAYGDASRTVEALAPVSLANPLAAARLRQGAATLSGRPIMTKEGEQLSLGGLETFWKAMGFQPVRLAEHQALTAHAMRMERNRRDQAQKFSGGLARAIQKEDDRSFQKVLDDWVEYNNKMIDAGRYADVITPESVESGVRARFQPKWPDVSRQKMILRQGLGGVQ